MTDKFLSKYQEKIYPGKFYFTLCEEQSLHTQLFLLKVIQPFPVRKMLLNTAKM